MKRRELGLYFLPLVVNILVAVVFIGYWANVVFLLRCDFKPSYREEGLRTVGVFVPPVGVVMGYLSLEEKESE